MNNFYSQSPYGSYPDGIDEKFSKSNILLPNRAEKRQLILLSVIAGLCILSFLGLQKVNYLIIIHSPALLDLYRNSYAGQTAIDILFSISCIFIPFLIAYFPLRRMTATEILKYNRPHSWKIFITAIFIGLIAFVLSNFVTGLLMYFLNQFGITLTAPETEIPSGFVNLMLYSVRGAVLPALIEEFAIRGIVMQPLRKFGDGFAIVSSSFIFAIMHGNLVQAPFAFLVGCVIGYVVIVTGTLWTGVIIHFINNMYSIVMTTAQNNITVDYYTKIFTAVAFTFIVLGIFGIVYFLTHRRDIPPLQSPVRGMSRKYYARKAVWIYMTTLPMIASIGFLIYYTMDYVSFGG